MTDSDAPLTNDELLSAYLDGELDDDHAAQVEQLLAASPETRRMLAELRAVGDRLRALPKQALGDGFAERVLQRAEREMLASPQLATISIAPADATTSRPLDWIRARGARPWVYAALTLAAGLLLMVFGPRDSARDQQLARNDSANAPASDASAKVAIGNHPEPTETASAVSRGLGRESDSQQPEGQGLREALDKAGYGQIASEVAESLAPGNDPKSTTSNDDDLLLIVADAQTDAAEENLRHLLSDNSISIEGQHRVSEQLGLDETNRYSASDKEREEFRRAVSASVMVVDGTTPQLDAAMDELRADPLLFQNVQKLNVPSKSRAPALAMPQLKVVPPMPATPPVAAAPPASRPNAVAKSGAAAKAPREKQEGEGGSAGTVAAGGKAKSQPTDHPAMQAATKPAAGGDAKGPAAPSPATTAAKSDASPKPSASQPQAKDGFYFTTPPAASRRNYHFAVDGQR